MRKTPRAGSPWKASALARCSPAGWRFLRRGCRFRRQRRSFDLRGTARPILEQVAAAYGIQLQFEDGYQGPAAAFTFRMNDLSMQEAFHALETITNSFLVPVNPKLAMVYQDTTQRRNDDAPLVTAEIPIPERISVQEAQEMVSAVQQVMQVRRIAVDPGRRMVFLRDQPGTVLAARQILTNLSRNRAQVNIEVELLSVSKNSTSDLRSAVAEHGSGAEFRDVSAQCAWDHRRLHEVRDVRRRSDVHGHRHRRRRRVRDGEPQFLRCDLPRGHDRFGWAGRFAQSRRAVSDHHQRLYRANRRRRRTPGSRPPSSSRIWV